MHAKVKTGGFLVKAGGAERALGRAVTGAMRDATNALKQALRDEANAVGLGNRVANTWRGRVYPDKGDSIEPTGFIWSKAPKIAQFFDSGNAVVPINGHRYLAVPTPAARQITGKKGARLTIPQVEAKLGRPIIVIPGKNGHLLGLFDQSLNAKGVRKRGATKRDMVLLYTFVPMVPGQKRLDVQSQVGRVAGTIPGAIDKRIAQ
jgi:hypothetical protein